MNSCANLRTRLSLKHSCFLLSSNFLNKYTGSCLHASFLSPWYEFTLYSSKWWNCLSSYYNIFSCYLFTLWAREFWDFKARRNQRAAHLSGNSFYISRGQMVIKYMLHYITANVDLYIRYIRYKIRNTPHLNYLENHKKMKYYRTKSGWLSLYDNHFSFRFINFCAFFLICLSIHFKKSYFTNFFHYYSLIFRTFSYCYLCNIPI